MKEIIKINNEISIDLQKLIDSRLLIQANSGGGKSWLIRRLLEQSHGKVQQIVLDLEGEFSTLREKYDYILAGKGGDIPAQPKSAGLLAHKLLEMGVSAIIDLYELPHQERKRFVRLFLEAMINAPKELWHSVIVVVDEAHIFVPEKGESEAAGAVIDLATRGRKRGFCAVLATQRLSKLHKDAAAECNNKLVGRAAMDIDMKRASEELGFTSKEQQLSLRNLEAGEFYAYGPAISRTVIKVKVGDVKTSHPQAGSRILTKTIPPTEKIRSLLKRLTDLPQEAEREAMTTAELRKENIILKREAAALKRTGAVDRTKIERIIVPAVGKRTLEDAKKAVADMAKFSRVIKTHVTAIDASVNKFSDKVDRIIQMDASQKVQIAKVHLPEPIQFHRNEPIRISSNNETDKILPIGQRKILIAVAQHAEGVTREQLTILTGYKRSSRDTYIQRLREKGYIKFSGDKILATNDGAGVLGHDYKPLPTGDELREYWLSHLPLGEKNVLTYLVRQYPIASLREDITVATGYQRSSRDTYLQRLNARKLVQFNGREIKASDELFG